MPVLVAARYVREKAKCLVVTPNHDRALAWQAKLGICGIPDNEVRFLPSGISSLFEDSPPENLALSDRIGALRFLAEESPGIVLATAPSALERTLPADVLAESFVEIHPNQSIDLRQLNRSMRALGYERTEPVRVPGQFSLRGGILDIFPIGRELPVRIELFDDLVESMREFDPLSQRSIGNALSIRLSPTRETLLPEDLSHQIDLVERALHVEAADLAEVASSHLRDLIQSDLESLAARNFFDRLDLYRPLIYPESGCAIDLLPDTGWLILDEPTELDTVAARAEEELGSALESRARRGEILHSTAFDFMLPPERFGQTQQTILMSAVDGMPSWSSPETKVALEAESLQGYRGRSEALTQSLRNWLEANLQVIVATDQPSRAKAVLSQVELFPADTLDDGNKFVQVLGNLAGGFVAPELGFALITDHELFGVGRLKLPQKRFSEGAPIATVLDLKDGDYIVHINFGIGRFRGLVTREIEGVQKEFLAIEYAPPDKLFVPADQLDRVQKYLNPAEVPPKLNRLTGGDWRKSVGKAREEAREFARELIRLYAKRMQVTRAPYGPDTPWQAEMESTFPWVETPAQLRAINEAKADLKLAFPMDRLVCGDVGFGKTEVAIRAAFKVAQSGRQVAMLCPTTILSEQHFRSFTERLAPFPTRLELLNRFRTTAERTDILRRLEAGEIDIIIGTHALLSQTVKFHELGLVIIDEEQRFGVKQKEALKHLRTSVDILSMSATPIPRTLSMALMDIRQLSLINDPPPGRLPVRTFVRPFAKEVVREAILRELARGGQVYYVYNRVEGIFHIAEALRKLVPQARIGVGHGQMSEKDLEPVMIAFIKGEIDILLSTTIVENGLDIPNANTLIVENAERMGLSQLYQLRGRVGRSDRQAYAYLLYQHGRELNDTALQRLQALAEFSTLGSGYSLAFRDLQIRGAGELLGSKQHGAMANVGYELFTQLIQQEVQFLKAHADGAPDAAGDAKDPLAGLAPLPAFDLPISAFIPDTYIREQAQRLYYYKALMSARMADELGEVRAELVDRYGRLPQEAERAFAVMHLRIRGRDVGIEKLDGTGGRLAVTFRENAGLPPRVISLLARSNQKAFLNRDTYVWPYAGSALDATEAMIEAIEAAFHDMEEQRALAASLQE
ncbi:MAG: Transcription-repair-coupling factor [Fimbriimonadaceae bacterium]|nr:Transcription-repair-coupling factor [Fimbriimonadaceae bacterium]